MAYESEAALTVLTGRAGLDTDCLGYQNCI